MQATDPEDVTDEEREEFAVKQWREFLRLGQNSSESEPEAVDETDLDVLQE